MEKQDVVIGLGEIGKPLMSLIQEKHSVIGVDIDSVNINQECDVMHICYPFEIENFTGVTIDYMNQYNPSLTIIHSTVIPGTTRNIFIATGKLVAHSPIRGKHYEMEKDLIYYTKFIGGINDKASKKTKEHFESLGMKTKVLSCPEATELAKLTATTYFGLLISWAQEVERYCKKIGVNYDEVVSFFEEIGYLPPVKYTSGVIGGHCVMPNIKILNSVFHSDILESIQKSNALKKKETNMNESALQQ